MLRGSSMGCYGVADGLIDLGERIYGTSLDSTLEVVLAGWDGGDTTVDVREGG